MKDGFISEIFPLQNSWLLILSLVTGGVSIYFSFINKRRRALFCLFITALFVRLFMAHLDPFLHDWDERFHALAARNMMHDPFKPMLRISDWVPYDYKLWCCNHIWLHKQPLFLWQMALSMKIFGVSEYAIRYPGVLMGSIGVLMLYRISYLVTANRHIAFIAALLSCFSYYPLELLSGHFGMDQNDTAFSFYVLASLWSYAEYFSKHSVRFAMLTGFFAGCAILVKWFPGLLVFSGWGIILLLNFRQENFKSELKHYLLAILACLITFLPWQIYILYRFPAEASYEVSCYSRHLNEAFESFSGDWMFYISKLDLYYGNYLSWLLPFGIAVILIYKKYQNKLSFIFIVYFLIFLVFYSFIVQTKIPGYFMMALPVGNIFIAIAVFHIISPKKIFKFIYIPTLLFIAMVVFDLSEITRQHDPGKWEEWKLKSFNERIYKDIRKYLPERIKLVVNAKDYIDIMFYHNDIDAYSWLPEEEYNEVKRRHLPVGICNPEDKGIYSYLLPYDSAFIIPVKIK